MEQATKFQLENPLSPKKFWKKTSNVLAVSILLAGTIGSACFIITWSYLNGDATTGEIYQRMIITDIALALLCASIGALYVKAYIRKYYYDVGEQFITIKKGVFAPTEIHVQYPKIQDVYVDQDIVDRILGIYDVHIASATATSGIEAHIDGVEKDIAENIKNIILGRISGHSYTSTESKPLNISETVHDQEILLQKEISSITYPPSSKYYGSIFIYSILMPLFVLLVIFGRTDFSFRGMVFIYPSAVMLTALYKIIWFKNYSFSFDRGMITIKTRVISTNETHVPYHTIQDVVLKQNILERLLGIGTVTIQNASQAVVGRRVQNGANIIAQPIEKANELVSIVREVIEKTKRTSTGL